MTYERDLARLLDHWLADGPVVVADRVIDDVASRIVRQPQRPAWRLLTWRIPSMPSTFKVAVAALAVVAAATGLLLITRPRSSGPAGLPASATPSVGASATHAPTASPSARVAVCEDDLPGCEGPLAAGAHGSAHFAPRLIHYDTPAGWTNSIDTSTIYKLDGPGGASILLWTDISIEDQTPTSCEPAAKSGRAAPLAADWVAYLTSHPGLVTTAPAEFDFPGNRDEGTQALEITLDPGWNQSCPGRTVPEVLFIAHPTEPAAAYGVTSADRVRVIVFDTGSYGPHTVLVEVYGPRDDAGFAATLGITDPVLKSFVFGCGPGAGYGPCSGYPHVSP